MKRIIILILVLLASETFLSAQVTRTQADATVRKYLQDEMIAYSLLYVYADEPNEEGISITTSNDETFKVKYACWAYYADESETAQRRYLFVRESNENLLEVIASNDLSSDPERKQKHIPYMPNKMYKRNLSLPQPVKKFLKQIIPVGFII